MIYPQEGRPVYMMHHNISHCRSHKFETVATNSSSPNFHFQDTLNLKIIIFACRPGRSCDPRCSVFVEKSDRTENDYDSSGLILHRPLVFSPGSSQYTCLFFHKWT